MMKALKVFGSVLLVASLSFAVVSCDKDSRMAIEDPLAEEIGEGNLAELKGEIADVEEDMAASFEELQEALQAFFGDAREEAFNALAYLIKVLSLDREYSLTFYPEMAKFTTDFIVGVNDGSIKYTFKNNKLYFESDNGYFLEFGLSEVDCIVTPNNITIPVLESPKFTIGIRVGKIREYDEMKYLLNTFIMVSEYDSQTINPIEGFSDGDLFALCVSNFDANISLIQSFNLTTFKVGKELFSYDNGSTSFEIRDFSAFFEAAAGISFYYDMTNLSDSYATNLAEQFNQNFCSDDQGAPALFAGKEFKAVRYATEGLPTSGVRYQYGETILVHRYQVDALMAGFFTEAGWDFIKKWPPFSFRDSLK